MRVRIQVLERLNSPGAFRVISDRTFNASFGMSVSCDLLLPAVADAGKAIPYVIEVTLLDTEPKEDVKLSNTPLETQLFTDLGFVVAMAKVNSYLEPSMKDLINSRCDRLETALKEIL